MLDTSPRRFSAAWCSRGGGPVLWELSVAEQRYQAVLAVIEDGVPVTEVAAKVGVSRQTLHSWLSRYAGGGLEALADRSHRPRWSVTRFSGHFGCADHAAVTAAV